MSFEMNYAEEIAKKGVNNVAITANKVDKTSLNNSVFVSENPIVKSDLKHAELYGIGIQDTKKFEARTFDSDTDFRNTPVRDWAIKDYLLCGYINLLVAPGAVGKSVLTIVEAISVATGKDLLGLGKVKQCNVLIINNEDDDDELNRRIDAVCKYYYIDPSTELKERLFVRSGYGERVAVAHEVERIVRPTTQVPMLIDFIKEAQIGMLVFDPFISTHDSDENQNNQIDKVVDQYKLICKATSVVLRLAHHTKKLGDDVDKSAGNIEIARGASSLKDAARVCHTLTPMSNNSAKSFGISEEERRRIIRIDGAKTNFSVSGGEPKYLYIESVQITNGEWIGVPRPYVLPDSIEPEKETPESRKTKTIHTVGMATLNVLGTEGGKIKATEMRAEYRNLARCGVTTADDDCKLLPISPKSERIFLLGRYYRIYQTKDNKKTAPRYIYLQPGE
jgi:hypothetical protein